MGIQQSREDTEPTLRLLRSISAQVLASAKGKLRDLSVEKCKMHVTKWELLLILQMNARDIKTISQFITGQHDPTNIDINSLYVLLVITSQHVKFEEKIDEIVNFVAFDIEITPGQPADQAEGNVSIDEMRYLFQLGYQLLNRVTDLDLISKPFFKGDQDERSMCGSQAEQLVIAELYGKGLAQKELVARGSAVGGLRHNADVQRFLKIFFSGKVGVINDQRADSSALAATSMSQQPLDQRTDLNQSADNEDATNLAKKDGGRRSALEQSKNREKETIRAGEEASRRADSKMNVVDQAQEVPQGVGSSPSKASKVEQIKTLQQTEINKATQRIDARSSNWQSQEPSDSVEGTRYSQKWGNHSCAGIAQSRSPHSLVKMSKRIMELRNENLEQIQVHQQQDNLQKLTNNVNLIMEKQLDFYAQRQLISCMHTLFAQKKAAEIEPGAGTERLAGLLHPLKTATSREAAYFSEQEQQALLQINVKRTLRNNLEEFLQQQRVFVKHQKAATRAKMMYFFANDGSRGQKRALEQRKFRLLGQLQTLRAIFSTYVQSDFDMEMLQGDKLYQNIYTQITNLYKSQIDQRFLIDMIDLKNKKRESKRFISFLEGAKAILESVCNVESLNIQHNNYGIPPIYLEAKQMVSEKLDSQRKTRHLAIIKMYSYKKIQMINYFTNLGKLKALYKIQQANQRMTDSIKDMFTENIKKIQIKLEKVDSELIQFLQNQQMKQNIYSSYFSAIGKLAVIKCGTKGVDFAHIYDYLVIALIKQRTYEGIWVQIDAKNHREEKQYDIDNERYDPRAKAGKELLKMDADSLASLMKLQKMKHMDKLFSVGSHTDSVDSGINHAKYSDELEALIAAANKNSIKFNYNDIDIKEKKRDSNCTNAEYTQATIKANLSHLYNNLGLNDLFKVVNHFYDNSSLKKKEFYLDHSQLAKKTGPKQKEILRTLKELDKLDNFFFDFVPIIEKGEAEQMQAEQDEEDANFMSYVGGSSTSMKLIYQDESRKLLYKEKKIAYKYCCEYLERLLQFDEADYEDDFPKHRDSIFTQAIQVLFKINRKGYLNFFNLKFLSLPIEHSIQGNYQAYQVVKMHIKESMKAKITADISSIANSNEIMISTSVSNEAGRESGQDVINITQGSAHGNQGSFGNISKSQLGRKGSHAYHELFALLNNSDQYDRTGKQSILKPLINQLDFQINLQNTQTSIFQETLNQFDLHKDLGHEKDMNKVKKWLNSKINQYIDEERLALLYSQYEIAFIQYNRLHNQGKQLDSVLQGSVKYLNVLKETMLKEITSGEHANANRNQIDFLSKLTRDIQSVQQGLQGKARQMMDKSKKQKVESSKAGSLTSPVSSKKNSVETKKARKSESSSSPTKVLKPKGDLQQFEEEMKYLEQQITTQLVSMVSYHSLLIGSRQEPDVKNYNLSIKKKLFLVNAKKDRLEMLAKYFNTVAILVDNATNNLDGLLAHENQARGARLMNAVLSGNIVNQIDIYQHSKNGESNQNALTQSSLRDSPGASEREQMRSSARAASGSTLTSSQRCLNYLSNYLSQVCLQEDILSSNRILKDSPLFFVTHMIWLGHHQEKAFMQQKFNQKYAIQNLVNVYEIQQTPITKYLQSFEKQTIFVKKDIFEMLRASEEKLLVSRLFELISKKGSSIVQAVFNRIDEVFCEANLDDEEKTDFSTAQTKIRRLLDQNLRTFREWLDAEANKKLTAVHESALRQQENKLIQTITSMQILVQVYYLKQIQQQEDFLFDLQQERAGVTAAVQA